MTDETQVQAQDVPTAQELPVAQPLPQIQAIPALKGVSAYFSLGPGNGSMPQLYSYDITLGQWRIAQSNEIEQMMISLGVPPNVLQALKNFRV